MVKAQDLINQQKKREELKYKSFFKIYETVEKKIILASDSNFYQVWYEIPQFIIGQPKYKLTECKEFVTNKLKADGFNITEYDSNIILIKWNP